MSDHVLVGVALDDHDAAPIGLGRALARLTTRRLALLHAYPYEPLTMREPEYKADLRERAEEGLARLAESIDDDDLEVRLHTFPRLSAARALQEAAEQIGAVAVVVGSSRGEGLRNVVAGRTGERLLAGAPSPSGSLRAARWTRTPASNRWGWPTTAAPRRTTRCSSASRWPAPRRRR